MDLDPGMGSLPASLGCTTFDSVQLDSIVAHLKHQNTLFIVLSVKDGDSLCSEKKFQISAHSLVLCGIFSVVF